MDRLLSNGLEEKVMGNDALIKVDYMHSLFKKSP